MAHQVHDNSVISNHLTLTPRRVNSCDARGQNQAQGPRKRTQEYGTNPIEHDLGPDEHVRARLGGVQLIHGG